MNDISGDYLRSQRGNVSVLKSRLANIRSADNCLIVFVLEGDGDLSIYEAWITRYVNRWEAIPANGKKKVLEFREMLERDKTGLNKCVFFIVDHDYDGFCGMADERVFVLPAYSAENFIVTREVVDSVLRTNFGLAGMLQERGRILDSFESALSNFIVVMTPICKKLYAAQFESLSGIAINDDSPNGMVVELSSVRVVREEQLHALIRINGDISPDSLARAEDFFSEKDALLWVRGKFLLKFLRQWLGVLAEDRRSARPSLFPESKPRSSLSQSVTDLGYLAGRASSPPGFMEFVHQSANRCEMECASH